MTTLLSSQSASGSAITFTGIPGGYTDLIVDLAGVSHDYGANATIRAEVSPDGSTWSPALAIVTMNASLLYTARLTFEGYTDDLGAGTRVQPNAASPSLSGSVGQIGWNCTGGIRAVRISMSAGNFDAGTINLSAR